MPPSLHGRRVKTRVLGCYAKQCANKGIHLSATDTIVSACQVYQSGREGIMVGSPALAKGATVTGCNVGGCCTTGGGGGSGGIVFGGGYNLLVVGNSVSNQSAPGPLRERPGQRGRLAYPRGPARHRTPG